VVELDVDPFALDVLADPLPVDTAIREAAPFVWLPMHGVWATGRHEEVAAAFRDPATWSSAAGTGLTDIRRGETWRPPSVLLDADPPAPHPRPPRDEPRASAAGPRRAGRALRGRGRGGRRRRPGRGRGRRRARGGHPLGAANRDPRRWDDPDAFDLHRRAAGHTAFGAGVHNCVGQVIARMEAEALLGTLARRVARLEPTGDSTPRLSNWLLGFASVPVRFVPA
jgi:cytochrome P450